LDVASVTDQKIISSSFLFYPSTDTSLKHGWRHLLKISNMKRSLLLAYCAAQG